MSDHNHDDDPDVGPESQASEAEIEPNKETEPEGDTSVNGGSWGWSGRNSYVASFRKRYRLRDLIDRYFPVVVLVVVLVVLAGGVLTYTVHVSPGTEMEQRTVSEWQETGEFSHEATVVNESEVFAVGETLEDRTTYYTRLSPTLEGTYEYGYMASEGDLETTVELLLYVRSVDGDGEVLWQQTDELDRRTVTLEPGETVTSSFQIDVPSIEERIDRIEDDLGASPGQTEVFLEATVDATGSVDGESVSSTHSTELPISPGGSTYGVEPTQSYTDHHERTEPHPVERSYGLPLSVAGPVLLFGGLFLGLTLGVLRAQDAIALSPAERRTLEHRRARETFDDWITRGTIPSGVRDRPVVETDSLEGLVDVAIDTDGRVIENAVDARYYVLEDVLYVHDPDGEPNDVPTKAFDEPRRTATGNGEQTDRERADAEEIDSQPTDRQSPPADR